MTHETSQDKLNLTPIASERFLTACDLEQKVL